jgi:lipid II:glycine glycyltransferase (peptidoglycan interpeptide bridge formation enzyme)
MLIINPITYPGYDQLVRDAQGSIFLTSNWAAVLAESYRYTPRYFAEIRNSRLELLLPFMEVNSILTGKRGVSLPFTDFCDPVLPENGRYEDLMAFVTKYGKKSGWKFLEMRSGKMFPSELPPSSFYYTHTLDLSQPEEEIFQGLRDSTGRNIKKAAKEGVHVTLDTSPDSLKEFYRLNCSTRKDHGLPPQPFFFFKKIHEHILSKGLGHIILASYKERRIAGAIFFHFGDLAVYKYGASDRDDQHLRANNLVMWEAIRWYRKNGYHRLSFGRTEPQNDGLLQFKRGWGAKEETMHYYHYNCKEDKLIRKDDRITDIHNKIFRFLPIPILRLTGNLVYRHMG